MKTRLPGFARTGAWWFLLLAFSAVIFAADVDLASLRAKAEKGNGLAQYNLGLAYAEGKETPKDLVEAYVWFRLAIENGGTGTALGGLLHQMSDDEIAAGRQRLEERRRAIPTVVADHHGASSRTPLSRAGAKAPPAPTEDRFAAMQEELASLRVDNARLTQQLTARRGGPNSPVVPVVTADSKKAADLGAQLEAARKDLAAALKANDDLMAREKKLSDEQEALKRQIADHSETVQRLAAVESQLKEAQSTTEQLKKDNAGLQEHCTELTGRLAQAAPVAASPPTPAAIPADAVGADELARLKEELNRANSKVEMTVRSYALLRDENERLKAQLAQARAP